jgi:hypothetical protein
MVESEYMHSYLLLACQMDMMVVGTSNEPWLRKPEKKDQFCNKLQNKSVLNMALSQQSF